MEITHHPLQVQRTAHVYTCGSLSGTVEEIWILLHGYSQEADTFLSKFEILATENRFLIAPQGLSQFYSSASGGKTAASWMTRNNRTYEIADYLHYLDHAVYHWIAQISHHPKIYLLGFSQGAETACRWFVSTNYQIDHLIICSGLIPHDIDIIKFKNRLSKSRLSLVHGSGDKLIPDEIREDIYKYMADNQVSYTENIFSGGHRVDPASIQKIAGS